MIDNLEMPLNLLPALPVLSLSSIAGRGDGVQLIYQRTIDIRYKLWTHSLQFNIIGKIADFWNRKFFLRKMDLALILHVDTIQYTVGKYFYKNEKTEF